MADKSRKAVRKKEYMDAIAANSHETCECCKKDRKSIN